VRILKLLTGYSKVSLSVWFVAIEKQWLISLSEIQLYDICPNIINCEDEQVHINVGVDVSDNHRVELELEDDACELELEVLYKDREISQLELEEESLDNAASPLSGIPDVGSFVITESWRPEVGTMFGSLDNAELQIKAWAINVGFEVKRGHMKSGAENLGAYLVF
jgi:hypothetical protein